MDPLLEDIPNSSTSLPGIVLVFVAVGLLFIGVGVSSLRSSPHTLVANQTPVYSQIHEISIEISGAVAHPGVQKHVVAFGEKLPLEVAIATAGGILETADHTFVSTTLHTISAVKDGQKITIPFEGERVDSSATSEGLINVNTASAETLMTLPSIGKVRAEAIISHRPYLSSDDLKEKAKLSAALIEKLEEKISF